MYVWMDGWMHACTHACMHTYIYIYRIYEWAMICHDFGSHPLSHWVQDLAVVLSCRQVGITPKIPWFRRLSHAKRLVKDWHVWNQYFPRVWFTRCTQFLNCLLEIACIRLKRARSRIHVVSARKLFAPCLQVTPGKGLGTLNFRVKLFQSPLVLVNKQSSTSYNML